MSKEVKVAQLVEQSPYERLSVRIRPQTSLDFVNKHSAK